MGEKEKHISAKELRELISGCVIRNRSCQQRIYAFYSPVMMAICLRYSKNREEAEEVLQDGFLQVYRCIAQFNFRGSFEGWMRKIMINSALQRFRGKANQYNRISLVEEQFFLNTECDLSDRTGEKELIKLIHMLPPACRMVFNLYVFEGMKHREIARLLNITTGTSKSNLYDARKILQKQLIPEFKMV
jgi:RNA polymerase sigma factor (sigma-70 family)